MSKLFSLFVLCLWAAEVAQASSTVAVVTMLHEAPLDAEMAAELQDSSGDTGVKSIGESASDEQGAGGCKMSSWDGAGPCSERCGGGKRSWRRVVVHQPLGVSKCPPLMRMTACNVQPCGNTVEEDSYAWGDWTSAKRDRVNARRARNEAHKAASNAKKLRKKVTKAGEKRLKTAQSKATAAFSKTTDAVQGKKNDVSPLEQPEFKDFVKKTEEVVQSREQNAKESESKAHLRKVQHTRSAPKESTSPQLPDATAFSHTAIYQNKLGDGARILARAKEITQKVSSKEHLKQAKARSQQQSPDKPKVFKEHKWASQSKGASYEWYTPPNASLTSAGVEFDQAQAAVHPGSLVRHFDRATDHYKEAAAKIKKQHKRIVKTTPHSVKASLSLGDAGMASKEPTQAAFAEAKTILKAKLEAISERRVKAESSESTGVVPVQTQIDNAVHKAYDQAYQKANKHADATIKRIKDTAKEEVDNMKKQVEAKMETEQKVMDRNIRKVHELEKDSADVAKASEDKVKKVIDGKAKKIEQKDISKVEDTLAANQAIKQAKSKLKSATKEAFNQALAAAKLAHKGGGKTAQGLADAKAASLKHRVKFMRNQLKLTEKMVASAPESPSAGMQATKVNAKQDIARAQAKAQVSEAKCADAKAKVKSMCAAKAAKEATNKTNAANATLSEVQVVFLDMQGPKGEEKKLDKQLKKLDAKRNATNSEKQQVDKNLSKEKTCAAARSNEQKFCGQAKDTEKAEYDEKIKAAGQVAVAAKYKAARVASLEAQGQATKADLSNQDIKATELELKYRKLKKIPFKSSAAKAKPKLKLNRGEASLVKKLVLQQVSAALENAQAGSAPPTNPTGNDKKKEKKLAKKEGKAMIRQEKDKSKLKKAKSEAKAETNKSKKVIDEAASQLKQAKQQKNQTKVDIAQENLSSMKRTGMKMDLLANEKTKEVKSKAKGAKLQVKKLKKKVAVQEKMAASKGDVKAAKLRASAAELDAAKDAAKAKHGAYKAAMKAAKIASQAAMQQGPSYYSAKKEVYAADKSARLAGKASQVAVSSAQDVYQCNTGKVEQTKLAAKLVKAKAAYKTFLTNQKKVLDATTNQACERATKLGNKKEKAAKAAEKQKEASKKEIDKEQKKEKKQESAVSVKRQWDIVKQNGILTATLPGMNVSATALTLAVPPSGQVAAKNSAAQGTTTMEVARAVARPTPQQAVQGAQLHNSAARCAHCKAQCKTPKCSQWCEHSHCSSYARKVVVH